MASQKVENGMAKQKSSDPRRANFEECSVLLYAAMTRQFAATQELATFCDAIKLEAVRFASQLLTAAGPLGSAGIYGW
jgi:hypothetical protein